MSKLIAFQIYRTEQIVINGELFTVNFTKKKDGEEYRPIAINDDKTKQLCGSYSVETANDSLHITGRKLEEEVSLLSGCCVRPLL
jgi:hypothetical protein